MPAAVYEAVIFDMDGLLLDTEQQYMRAMQRCADSLGYRLEEDFLVSLIGHSGAEADSRMRRMMGDAFPFEHFRAEWPKVWVELVEDEGVDTKPGVEEILELLRRHTLPCAIATSSNGEHASRSLDLAGVAHHFDIRVTGDQVDNGKPAPDIYLEAARRLGVEPTRCFALEDSEVGLTAASGAGMTCFMVPDIKPASENAFSMAHRVVDSLHEAVEIMDRLLSA